jgi:hypothetical protein
MKKVKVGQRWSNVTRNQIIEIQRKKSNTPDNYSWYKIIEQDAINTIDEHRKSDEHINRLYTLIC